MDFANNLIQEQSVWQLVPSILSKKTSKQCALSDKECHQITELDVLWTKTCDPCCVISLAGVEVLVKLVCQNVLQFSYVMHGFLTQISSTRHLLGPIRGVTKLLCLQATESTEIVSYSLQSSNLHPYIKILASSPVSWPILLQEIDNLFQETNNSFTAWLLKAFEAFFQHVLYHPKPDYAACKSMHVLLLDKASELLEEMEEGGLNIILNLISNHIRLYKTNVESLGHSVSLCHQTLRWFLKNNSAKLERHMKSVTVLLIEMMHKQLSCGMSMMSSLVLLKNITCKKPWIPVASGSFFFISHLMLTSSEYYVGELVQIATNLAHYILTNNDVEKCKLSFLVLPLLQILSLSRHSVNEKTAIFSLASKLLSDIENSFQSMTYAVQTENKEESLPQGMFLKKSSICESMFVLIKSSDDESTLLNWLKSVEKSISNSGTKAKNYSFISLLLSSFLLTCSNSVAVYVLSTIASVCKTDPTQAPYFFPLMLLKMEKCSSPEVKLQVLQTIPKLATHKVCVKQALSILLVLNNNSELKAITLRLMFKLWMRQPRVFPHLDKLLQEKTLALSPEARTELQLAKAITIRDICRERPTQHGEGLVGLISTIIDENAHQDSKVTAVLVCLALESLQFLVETEVLNLASMWQVLKIKLEYHSSPLVVAALCDLFSLTPSLVVETQDYKVFKEYVLSYLWRHTEHESESISDAAYKALAKFKTTEFLIRHLPKQTRQTVIHRLQSTPKIKKMLEESLENEEVIDLEKFPVPAYFYAELLLGRISGSDYQGLEEFLKSIVSEEVSNLPRGVAHNTMKSVETTESKLMASIPEFLKKEYEKCKQPSLKSFIAVSLLYCYELPVENRSGKPLRSQAVNNIKLYRQLINQLVQDVPVKSSEWQSNAEISQAWAAFMSRVFTCFVQGRKMELELQIEREHIGEEEFEEGIQNAWLWARDALTDLLKAASKGSHVMQGNSLLALAGLVCSVFNYQTSIVQNEEEARLLKSTGEIYITAEEWIARVTDAMLVILDGNIKTLGAPMAWCQQISATSSIAILARACSAIGLAQIIPALVDAEFERLRQVFNVLQMKIPGQTKTDSSALIQAHCSVGLGIILQKLYKENISDSLGQEGNIMLAKSFNTLERAALSTELENTEGAIFGLGLAMSSLNKEIEAPMSIQSIYSKMIGYFENVAHDQYSQKVQELGYALAYCTGCLFAAECVETASVINALQLLNKVVQTCSENAVLASALGMLLHNLKESGLPKASVMVSEWTTHWHSVTTNMSLSWNSRVAAVSGLSSLFGSMQTNQTAESSSTSKPSQEEGVKVLKQLLNSRIEVNFHGNIYWNLGRLCFANKKQISNLPTVPATLDYLGEDSVLNAVIHFLIHLSKEANQKSEGIVNMILPVLSNGPQEPLPPLHWNSILTPLLKKYTGSTTTLHFLDLALRSTSSHAVTSFFSGWLTSSVVLRFTAECKILLYSSLPRLVEVLSATKYKDILAIATTYFSQDKLDTKVAEAILDGLCSLLKMPELPKSVFPCIKDTIQKIYHCFPSHLQLLIPKLAVCIQCLPDDEIEKMVIPQQEFFVKSVMIKKEIILGKPSLLSKLLKPCMDLPLSSGVTADALVSFASTLSCIKLEGDNSFITEWIMQYLAELCSTDTNVEAANSILLILTVLSLPICENESDILKMILSLQDGHVFHNHTVWFSSIRNLFPCCFASLLSQPKWKEKIEKIIDKLLSVCKSLRNCESSRLILDCLLEMRGFEIYEKRVVWTQVVSCL